MASTSYIKSKILIVIDRSRELSLVRDILQEHGYQTQEADTVSPAFELARQHLPELVLLDITAPALGLDSLFPFIDYLQQQQIPLILITSESPLEELNKYLNFITLDYIQRPIDPVILILRIKSAIRYKKIQLALKLVRQKLEKDHRKLQQVTIFDETTGTFNYTHLQSLIKLEFARGVRYNAPFAVLLADIPQLNEIKADYGPSTGDYLLKEVAHLLKNSLRLTDIIGRCEGNRLGVLLSETNLFGAQKVVDRIHSIISEHCFSPFDPAESATATPLPDADKLPLKLHIKLGFSAYPDKKIANYEELLEAANQALLKAGS